MSDRDKGAFWIGLLLGGLAGTAIGASLIAQADPETRERLKKTSQELAERSTELAAKSRQLSLNILEKAGTQAVTILEQLQETMDREADTIQEAALAGVEAGREEIRRLGEKTSPTGE